MKRWRKPTAKSGELLVKYGKDEGGEDLFFCWPENEVGMKRDANMLMSAFHYVDVGGSSIIEELQMRGYDITTLKFSIMKKQQPTEQEAGHD